MPAGVAERRRRAHRQCRVRRLLSPYPACRFRRCPHRRPTPKRLRTASVSLRPLLERDVTPTRRRMAQPRQSGRNACCQRPSDLLRHTAGTRPTKRRAAMQLDTPVTPPSLDLGRTQIHLIGGSACSAIFHARARLDGIVRPFLRTAWRHRAVVAVWAPDDPEADHIAEKHGAGSIRALGPVSDPAGFRRRPKRQRRRFILSTGRENIP